MSENPSAGPRPDRAGTVARFLLVGGASVLVARIVALGSGTASHMLLARLLQPEMLAAYFLTQSVVEVGAQASHLGLPRPLTRFVAQAMGRGEAGGARGALLAALPLWLAAVGLVALVYLGGFGDWLAERAFHSEIMATGTVFAAAWLIFSGASDLLAGALRGFRKVGLASWVGGGIARLVMACVLLVWFLVEGRAEFVPVLGLAAAAALLGSVVALPTLGQGIAHVASQPLERRVLMASALPLLLTGVIHMSYVRADLWTVGALFEPGQVALYGAAKRLIVIISLPLVILNLVVPPIVAELHAQGDLVRLQRALRGAATLAGLPALLALLVFAFASEQVLGIAFGEFYREGALVLTLLSLERFVFVWVGPSGTVLSMTGQERALMTITLVSGLATVTAVLMGAKLYGFTGVAIGYVVGSSGQQIATWEVVRRTTGVRTDIDLRNLEDALDALRRALRR